jgi:hypothetical protein
MQASHPLVREHKLKLQKGRKKIMVHQCNKVKRKRKKSSEKITLIRVKKRIKITNSI